MNISRAEFIRSGAWGLGAALLSPLPAAELTMNTRDSATPPVTAAFDLRDFLRWILDVFEPAVRLPGGAGRYARSPTQSTIELYGVADMACVLFSCRNLRPSEAERAEWAAAFREFLDPQTGWFREKDPTHDRLHNMAFALGAMELLDLRPGHPVHLGPEFADPRAFLETIDWAHGVYSGSHRGAGLGAIRALLPEPGTTAWFADYFAYCDSLFDPSNGLMGRGKPAGGDSDQVGGTFHYHFLYTHFNRHMPFPERRIDAVLGLQQPDGYWHATNHLWLTLDAIYLMTRTLRQTPHRFDAVRASVRRALSAVQREFWTVEGRERFMRARLGVHSLTAAISIAAEAQQFLGAHEVMTDQPLRLVLDRRPFI